eukprot:TRINITY_DN9080_c0_g1_i1.p1 TRINITY_DN9080_c0_g1~~TRINITY_DN9080_c0_g1_i1.p1  ORF type:complete len:383 (+),score=64.00 TRINITY_DN9080_c0_g1_i1:71-1219(+)
MDPTTAFLQSNGLGDVKAASFRGSSLSHHETMRLLGSLMAELERRLSGSMHCASAEQRMNIMQVVKAEMLPQFGLPGSSEGDVVLMHHLARYVDDPSVAVLVKTLNRQSGMDEGACREFDDALREMKDLESRRSFSMPSFPAATAEACGKTLVKDETVLTAQKTSSRSGTLSRHKMLQLLRCLMTDLEWRLSGSLRYASAEQRIDIMQVVKAEVFPKYGLPGSSEGDVVLLHHLAEYVDDPSVAILVKTLNRQSGMDEGSCREFEEALREIKDLESSRSSSTLSVTAASAEAYEEFLIKDEMGLNPQKTLIAFAEGTDTMQVAEGAKQTRKDLIRSFASRSRSSTASTKDSEGSPFRDVESMSAEESDEEWWDSFAGCHEGP